MNIRIYFLNFALAVGLCIMNIIGYSNVAYAEIIEQTVEATGEYRLGDNDTRAHAKDLALKDAKRIAAEKVLVYIKTNSVIENFETVKDRIETYTQAKMQILEQRYSFVGEEGTLCQANIVANVKIDIDEIEEQQRIEEQRKREEQQRIEEQRRREEEQQRIEEQRRREEEQQRIEEQRRREEEERRRHEPHRQDDGILKTIISIILDRM